MTDSESHVEAQQDGDDDLMLIDKTNGSAWLQCDYPVTLGEWQ